MTATAYNSINPATSTTSSAALRVTAATAATGTNRHMNRYASLYSASPNDGSSRNPVASSSARFTISIGPQIVTATKAILASSSSVRLIGRISQSWSTPG